MTKAREARIPEAWAFITDTENAHYIDRVVTRFASRGIKVNADDFRQDLIEDLVRSWWQIYIEPKTGKARAEPLVPKTFVFVRARKVRLYLNREIDRGNKYFAPITVGTDEGQVDIGKCGNQDARAQLVSVLVLAERLATPKELVALRSRLDGSERKEDRKKTTRLCTSLRRKLEAAMEAQC